MSRKPKLKLQLKRVDVQVSLFAACVVVLASFCVFAIAYSITYKDMLHSLHERVDSIYNFIEQDLDKSTFKDINEKQDIEKDNYKQARDLIERIKRATGVKYLYTAKKNDAGELIYVVDGLDFSAGADFRYPGDLIESEIQDALNRALNGEKILPDDITHTNWGDIFISYLPIHKTGVDGEVIGVIGIEFSASHQYKTYKYLRIIAPLIILLTCVLSAVFALIHFKRISNPHFKDLSNTDYLTRLKNRNAYELDTNNLCALGSIGTGIILADLNGLKLVNDNAGHILGDLYLKEMANSLREAKSGSEVVYRVGGDEFVVLIKKTNEIEIDEFLLRLSSAFEIRKRKLPKHASYAVGFSICSENTKAAFEAAYKKADDNMYIDKKQYYDTL